MKEDFYRNNKILTLLPTLRNNKDISYRWLFLEAKAPYSLLSKDLGSLWLGHD